MDGVEVHALLHHADNSPVGLFPFVFEHVVDVLVAAHRVVFRAQRAGDADLARSEVELPDEHVRLLQQILQAVLVFVDGGVRLLHLLVVAQLFEIDVALIGELTGRRHIVFHFVVVVEDGLDAQLNVFLGAELGHVDVLADVEFFPASRLILALYERGIEEWRLEEPCFSLLCYFTEFAHVVVQVDEVAFFVVERHGNDVGLKDLHVFRADLVVDALFFDLLGNVADGVGDIAGLEVHIFNACQSAEPHPLGVFQRTGVQLFGVAGLL